MFKSNTTQYQFLLHSLERPDFVRKTYTQPVRFDINKLEKV